MSPYFQTQISETGCRNDLRLERIMDMRLVRLSKRSGLVRRSIALAILMTSYCSASLACPFYKSTPIAAVNDTDLVFRGQVISYTRERSGKTPRELDTGTMSFSVVETLRGPTKSEWSMKLIDEGSGLPDKWTIGDAVIVAAQQEPSEVQPENFVLRQKRCSQLLLFPDNENSSLAIRRELSSRR